MTLKDKFWFFVGLVTTLAVLFSIGYLVEIARTVDPIRPVDQTVGHTVVLEGP